jgi:hypothetical protein
MRTLIISAVLLAAVCLPRSALADINLSRYPGLAIQCGPARIIVQQDGTVKTTGLPRRVSLDHERQRNLHQRSAFWGFHGGRRRGPDFKVPPSQW